MTAAFVPLNTPITNGATHVVYVSRCVHVFDKMISGAKAFTLPSNPVNSSSGRPVRASLLIEPRPAMKPSRSARVTGFIRTRVRIQVEPPPGGEMSSLLFSTSATLLLFVVETPAETIDEPTSAELFRVNGEGRG